MFVIEVTEDKVSHLADTIGKMLHYGGKAMECIEEMREGSRHDGGRMGYRDDEDGHNWDRVDERSYSRGGRYGMRDDDRYADDDRMGERYPRDHWEEYPPYMGERRGRSATTGRYVRR